MTRTICIYHGNCADGFAAAWAVRRALGESVEFHPGVYGADPPDVAGADVILVDFSYKRPVLEAMAQRARSVLVLDHHATAQADLAGLIPPPVIYAGLRGWEAHTHLAALGGYNGFPVCLFDMKRSGAQMTWDFFHAGKKRPTLIDYVADRDLWRFALPHSREIAAWYFSHPYLFDVWDDLVQALEIDLSYARAAGEAIDRKHRKDVAELVKVARRTMRIGGHVVPVANLPYTLASDAGHLMAEGAPFAACYFDRADELRVFSLRSHDGGIDVSKVAAGYGGGGHKNAAGFQMPLGWEGDGDA